jgi:hypothetical protein
MALTEQDKIFINQIIKKYFTACEVNQGDDTSLYCIELRKNPEDLEAVKKFINEREKEDYKDPDYGEMLCELRDCICKLCDCD